MKEKHIKAYGRRLVCSCCGEGGGTLIHDKEADTYHHSEADRACKTTQIKKAKVLALRKPLPKEAKK